MASAGRMHICKAVRAGSHQAGPPKLKPPPSGKEAPERGWVSWWASRPVTEALLPRLQWLCI